MPAPMPFPTKFLAVAAELWAMHVSAKRIGKMLGGVSESRIAGLVASRRDLFPNKPPGMQKGTGYWTLNRLAEASRMWAEGKTSSHIAEHFGRDRGVVNAVIGRNRELFPFKPAPVKAATPAKAPKQIKAKAPRKAKVKKQPRPVVAKVKAPKPIAAPKPAPVAKVIQLDLPPKADSFRPLPGTIPAGLMRVCGCRWPVEPEDDRFIKAATYFCDAPRTWKTDRHGKARQSSYCGAHDAMSVGAGTPSERAAVRELARAG